MPIIRLILQNGTVPVKRKAPEIFSKTNLGRVYFPFLGLPHSVVVHLIAFAIVYFFASFPTAPPIKAKPRQDIVMIDLSDPLSMMYLPMFEGGRPEPGSLPGGGRKKAPKQVVKNEANDAPDEPPATTKGFSYPGPQPIVSDVPEPTNKFQTILQPQIENPPILPPPVLVPNIVQIAEARSASRMEEPPPEPEPEPPSATPPKVEPEPPKPAPAPAKEVPKPEPKSSEPKPEPKPKLPEAKPVDIPKPQVPPPAIPKPESKLPEPAPRLAELLKPEPKPPEPAPKIVETPKPQPKPPEAPKPEPKTAPSTKPGPKLPESSRQAEVMKSEPKPPQTATVVARPAQINEEKPVPAMQAASETAKHEEAEGTPGAVRDLVSITPMPASPGPATKVPAGEARGRFVISPEPNLTGSDSEPGMKAGTPASEVSIGNGKAAPAAKNEKPKPAQTAATKKAAPAALPAAKLKSGAANAGAVSGTGKGTGAGGSGNGTVAAQAPVKKPFAGITIIGGEYDPGSESDAPPVTQAIRPLQTAYGLNIISTEDSGGGLPFYGVFSHEQIYTVYLDMRTLDTDPDPSWTLEFAVIQESSAGVRNLGQSQQGLILPFPSIKEKPAWPVGLAGKYAGKMIVVYGIVNTAGKMEQISVKESPDAQLNEPVVRALSKWVFRPATLQGEPISVKALMGIPLWSRD